MLLHWIKLCVSHYCHHSGKLTSLYRRLCRPDGVAWGRYLKKHGKLHHIGDNCVIQANVVFTDPEFVSLGNNVHLTGCTLFGHDGSISMLKTAYGLTLDKVGKIEIADHVFVGHQAIIMPGVKIGAYSIVACGAIVTHDVPSGSIVGGIPARIIGQTEHMVTRLQQHTQQLPWSQHADLQADYLGPASDLLQQQRLAYFWGS